MKSLRQFSTALGLLGAVVSGSVMSGSLPAQALPVPQVIERLQNVPVFTITDPEGSPVVASVTVGNNQNPSARKTVSVAKVFISRADAAQFMEELKTKNPQLASTVQVVPVPLSAVYKMAQDNRNNPNAIEFDFVPAQSQVDIAKRLLTQQGKPTNNFAGVPLFVARGGQNQGYLTVEDQNKKPVIPFFFKKEELQTLLDRFKTQQPSLASSVEIQVVNLEGVIDTLHNSNDQQLNSIVLVPPQETNDSQGSQGGNQPPAAENATPRR